MEKNKITIRLCYIELIIFAGILVTMISHFRCGFGKSFLALMIIAALAGCGVSLALKDYLKSMIHSSAFDVAGVHNKKSIRKTTAADSGRRRYSGHRNYDVRFKQSENNQ